MTLDSRTGVLSGTPISAQTSAFTIQVSDSSGSFRTGRQRGQDLITRLVASRDLLTEN